MDKIEKTIDIAAPVSRVWRALTDSAWTRRWFHATSFAGPPQAGQPYQTLLPDGALATEGVVEELVPPTPERPGRLVQTWGVRWDPELAAEPAGRLEWTVSAAGEGRSVQVVDVRSLSPFDDATVTAAVRATGRAVVLAEAPGYASVAAEIQARVSER